MFNPHISLLCYRESAHGLTNYSNVYCRCVEAIRDSLTSEQNQTSGSRSSFSAFSEGELVLFQFPYLLTVFFETLELFQLSGPVRYQSVKLLFIRYFKFKTCDQKSNLNFTNIGNVSLDERYIGAF